MTLNFQYPWGSGDSRRAAIFREVIRLTDIKQRAAKVYNLELMKKADAKIRELRRDLGHRAWGKG